MFTDIKKTGPVWIIAVGCLLGLIDSLVAKPVGKFTYRGSPEDFTTSKFNGTVTVSDTMVAMSEKIIVLNKFLCDSILDTPSIFFIIDHSNSMSKYSLNGAPVDRLGNRFKVTSAFIDTIFKKFPSAEIGYAIFQSELFFRGKDNPLFKALPTTYEPDGAYLPLLKLNGTFSGQTGIAFLKRFLETQMLPSIGYGPYAELVHRPSELTPGGTNINVGFDAAKDAFSNSLQKTKECHYIIFLSDGDATDPDDNTFEFVKGKSVPTTFTIYFTPDNKVPENIVTMTTNIQKNGYSNTNPKSKYWPYINTDFDKLMNFLMDNIFDSIMVYKPAPPKVVTINGKIASAWNSADSSCLFNNLFPLIGRVTPFTCKIIYPTKTGDTTSNIDFNVQTQPGFVMPPADFTVKLWDRDILFRHNGAPVTVVTDAMNQIELSFPWNGGTANYKYTNVTIDLYTTAPPIDHETVTLTAGANVFTGTFRRATSAAKTAMNGTLENDAAGSDDIIAVFRNSESPKLPLDTLRVIIPVNPPASLKWAATQDLDGDGFLDHIVLLFDKPAAIANNAGAAFTIQGAGTTFPVESITKLTDSTYSLVLKEQTTPMPQTSWTPGITIAGLPGISNVTAFVPADGAPPVVWTVIKQVVSADVHTTDTVTITLSEKINGTGGAPFAITSQPYQTFFVWNKNGAVFTKVDTMLAGIITFSAVVSDSILVFTMSNNHDLNESHWMNIQDIPKLLCDKVGNYPTDSNQKVQVKIVYKIPLATLDSAVTCDVDGDGYLDHIDLYFSRYTDITDADTGSFSVRLGATLFPVSGIVKFTNRTYRLGLRQHAEPMPLETWWKPFLGIRSLKLVADVVNFASLDGAPPVIWTAVKKIEDALDRRRDTVTIVMSEKVYGQGHTPFSIGTQPAKTFFAWIKGAAGFTRVDDMFTGIPNFVHASDSTFVFAMSNDGNLTSNHWLNVRTPGPQLCDVRDNFPTDSNRKVRVKVLSPPISIHVVPNPSGPTVKQTQPGELVFQHEPDALKWVFDDEAGVVISLKNVEIPPDGTLKGYLTIHDEVGNPVFRIHSDDIVGTKYKEKPVGSAPEINIYWNGFNKSGAAVAPGVYRAVVYLSYPSSKGKTLYTKIGIRPM